MENVMELPIQAVREEFIKTVQKNQVVIVVGDPGSGKTTELPIYLHQAGLSKNGAIAITEPRRIAAVSVAQHVAQKMQSPIGDTVGYQVRFDYRAKMTTPIRFMTDGILLREFQSDPELKKFSVIVIDEAHERNQNIDILLGLLKDLLKRRFDLQVVIASATIDAEKFSRYFWDAPIIKVEGRMFPVEVIYNAWDIPTIKGRYEPEFVVQAIAKKVRNIHQAGKPGDILVFMTGKDDIMEVIDVIEEMELQDLIILPLFSEMTVEDQQKVFDNHPGKRKVIVSTNIAETSITIDGVVYVIDSGLVKMITFNPDVGMQCLEVVKHSQAGCNQRAGRAGRTQPGVCYRMFTEKSFRKRPAYTEPEIKRASLATVVLTMEDLGISAVDEFDFIDSIGWEAFHEAYQTLLALGAVKFGVPGVTEIGGRLARLPLMPHHARMVLEARKYACVKEVITIVAFLSFPAIFVYPRGKERESNEAHRAFKDGYSDAHTFIRIWRAYVESGFSPAWCHKNFLNPKTLQEIDKTRRQLFRSVEDEGIILSESKDYDVIDRSVVAGLIYNLFEHDSRYTYKPVFRTEKFGKVYVHPNSGLFGTGGIRWVVAADIVRTSKPFARVCVRVKREWLQDLISHTFSHGEVKSLEYKTGDRYAYAIYPLFFKGTTAGENRVQLELSEARKVQSQLIARAKEAGWKKLVFHVAKVLDDGKKILASDEGHILLDPKYELDVPYFCEVVEIPGQRRATPKFRPIQF